MTTTIVRDVDGVAHVRAGNAADAFRGQGYAAAVDRLWQMEFDRRRAAGTLAALIGPAGVASDILHRRVGIGRAAAVSLAALGDTARQALEAYAAGVNAAVSSGAVETPVELQALGHGLDAVGPWLPVDSIGLYQVRHLLMGTYEVKLWRSGLVANIGAAAVAALWPDRIGPTMVPSDGDHACVPGAVLDDLARIGDAITAVSAASDTAASNNLALAPSRTTTGAPILAGDPHRAIDLPNVYWQNHIRCPDFDVIGLSFAGVPGFPHFGHNASLAWCITHGMADDQDLFVERLRRTDDGVEVLGPDGWGPAAVRHETITVAGAPSETIEVVETAHGPIIAGGADLGVGLALAWTATAAPDTTFDALVPMLTATTVAELDRACAPWVLPCNNVLAADRDGSIMYRFRGRLARRPAANGWTVVAGWTADGDWDGFVPDAELTRVTDPDRGFLVTANNPIAVDGPYVSMDFAHPARASRLTARLAADDRWDIEAVGALLGDTHSAVAARFAARLGAVPATSAIERAAQSLLRAWDHRMDADSAAAAVYATCRSELVRLVAHDIGLLRDGLGPIEGPSLKERFRLINTRLATVIDDGAIVADATVADALRLGVRAVQAACGPAPAAWRWGALHRAGFEHPLLLLRPDLADRIPVPPPVELGGDNECVWASGVAPPALTGTAGPVARYVFDLADWDNSRWVVPHGVSGDPRADHHLDQLDDWAHVQYRPMRYTDEAIDAATESTIEL